MALDRARAIFGMGLLLGAWLALSAGEASETLAEPSGGFWVDYGPCSPDFSGSPASTITAGERIVRVESQLQQDWRLSVPDPRLVALRGSPPQPIRWSAELQVPVSGRYEFLILSHGQVNLMVGDETWRSPETAPDDSAGVPSERGKANNADNPSNGAGSALAALPQPTVSRHAVDLAAGQVRLTGEYQPQSDLPPRLGLYWRGPGFLVEPLAAPHVTPINSAESTDGEDQLKDRAWRTSQDVSAGETLFHALRCAACHGWPGEVSNQGQAAAAPRANDQPGPVGQATTESPPGTPVLAPAHFLPAPELRRGDPHLRIEWLHKWLTDPPMADRGVAHRRMPHWQLTPTEVEALLAVLTISTAREQPQQEIAPASAAHATPTGPSVPASRSAPVSSAAPTSSSTPASSAGDVERGRWTLFTQGCLACHRYHEHGVEGPLTGPDLTHLATKRTPGFVAQWLRDPAAIQPDHRMPYFDLTTAEIADLAALLEQSEPDISSTPPPRNTELPQTKAASDQQAVGDQQAVSRQRAVSDREALSEQQRLGEQILASRCLVCHREANSGSPLSTASVRLWSTSWDWDQGCAAQPTKPNQPRYQLAPVEAAQLATFVRSMWAAHGIAEARGPANRVSPEKDDTNQRGSGSLSSYWAARPQLQLESQLCLQCHDRSGERSPWREMAEQVVASEPSLAGQLPLLLPPSLRAVGDKLAEGAWLRWLQQSPPQRRPWLRLRMPGYHLSDPELQSLRQWWQVEDQIPVELSDTEHWVNLATQPLSLSSPSSTSTAQTAPQGEPASTKSLAQKNTGPPNDAPTPDPRRQLAGQLLTGQGFGCASCHAVGSVQPHNPSLTTLGPSLTDLASSVRPAWFRRWVHNPGRLVPNLEMPSVQTAVRSVLDDNLDQQLALLWQVVQEPGFEPPRSAVVRTLQHSGLPARDERSSVLTDCLRMPDDQRYTKPFLVALPNRHNVLMDLGTGRQVAWWQGAAAAQETEGKSWFWRGLSEQALWVAPPPFEWSFERDGVRWTPALLGQYVTSPDHWEHTSDGGVTLTHRLVLTPRGEFWGPAAWHAPPLTPASAQLIDRSASDDAAALEQAVTTGRAILLEVSQTWTPAWPLESAESPPQHGFRRVIHVRSLTSPQHGEWKFYVAGANHPPTILSTAELSWLSPAVTLQAVSTTPAAWQRDTEGYYWPCKWQGDQPMTLVLNYQRAEPFQSHVVVPWMPPPLKTESLAKVPGYRAQRLPIESSWMPTGFSWDPQGRLLVSSLKGDIWRAWDNDQTGHETTAQPISDEFAAPYGLWAHGDAIDVINKTGLLRLRDRDGDAWYESVETLADGWGHTADYHDWSVGLIRDEQGVYYVATACQQDQRSAAAARWRGKVLRLRQRETSVWDPRPLAVEILSAGHRFPMGLARRSDGLLCVTDNQGNYNPFNELNVVGPERRYGFLNAWEAKLGLASEETPPSIAIPHPWTRSVNGICFLSRGPFSGQLVGCEYDTRRLIRMSLQEVDGVWQGAAYPLSVPDEGPEGGFLGPICCAESPKGDLYIGGVRDSGWGGGNNQGEIVQLRSTPDSLPDGLLEVQATSHGFVLTFTHPISDAWIQDTSRYQIHSYRRRATPAYGGADEDRRAAQITAHQVSADRRRVELTIDPLRAGYVYEFHLQPAENRESFFPAEAFYTLQRIPASR